MPKKEPRLQFTDEERMDPELGKSVKKVEKAAAKACCSPPKASMPSIASWTLLAHVPSKKR